MKLKTIILGLVVMAFGACTAPVETEREVYIFTGHREPALNGLHLLYSYDGYKWDSLQGTWLTPMIGNKQPEYFNHHSNKMEEAK